MANRELVDYISDNLKMGHKPQQLRQILLKAGWSSQQVNDAFREISSLPIVPAVPIKSPSPQPAVQQKPMGILQELKTVLIHPGEFFEKVKDEKRYELPLRFYFFIIILQIVSIVFLYFLGLFEFPSLPLIGSLGTGWMLLLSGIVILMVIVVFLLTIIGTFIGAGILHIFAKIFGAKGGYHNTYKAFVYSTAPAIFSGFLYLNFGDMWLKLIMFLPFSAWGFILLVKGLSKLHNISGKRAFLIALMPILIALLIIFTLTFASFMLLSSYFSEVTKANIQIVDYYCATGTTATVVIRNMGTEPINLGDCTGNSISGTTKTCGSITIARTDGGIMSAGFSRNSVGPAESVVFTDRCTSQGGGNPCIYRFSVGSSSTPSTATVSCSG